MIFFIRFTIGGKDNIHLIKAFDKSLNIIDFPTPLIDEVVEYKFSVNITF